MKPVRLITIPISHYCEKARWALDRQGLAYVEERHFQIFHYLAAYRAARVDAVPVLVTPDAVMTDSTDILRWVDARAPEALKLYPAHPEQRRQIEAFEDELRLLPLAFPFVKGHLHKILELGPDSRLASKAIVDRAFDAVAVKLSDGRAFLAGGRFTAADLTFAALAASVLMPKEYGVVLPQLNELPPEMRAQVETWRAHPAGQFALRMFREHRARHLS